MLFTEITRTDHTPRRATETDFAFLDRCAWPAAGKVRGLLEGCLANYPEVEKAELISRLRSGDSRHFASGTFELFLHEYLLRLGFSLMPHPELPNGSAKRPDFLVTSPEGEQLYVEAICASDDDGRNIAAEARKAVALQALDDAYHANFMVAIDSIGEPATQPSGKRLAAEVVRWLDTLDADRVIADSADSYDTLPEYHWQHEDWLLRLRAIPVKPDARGLKRRLIGIRSFGAGFIDGWTPIRDAILTKARRYGELDLPLVVAVNVDTFNLDPIDESQALFGQEQYVFTVGPTEDEPRFARAPNGAWRGPSGPRGRRCSGAWLFSNLSPYTIAQRRHTLYLNPWGNLEVPSTFLRMPHALVVDDRIRQVSGTTLRDAFALDERWPE
jgi:hypothetical protein